MTKRTLSKTLPSETNDAPWPRHSGIKTGKIARVGATLPTLPFIRLSSGNREGPVEFEWTAIGRDGEPHDFYQIFRPGTNKMLPGPTGGRVIMALLSIPPGQNLQVEGHLHELTKLCHLQRGGRTYSQLRKALARLQGLTIETNAFWHHDDQKYLGDVSTKLFSSYSLNPSSSEKGVEVQWTTEVAELINSWSKPVHLDRLFRLKSYLARKLYQVSSLGIYQKGEMVEDLKILCHGQLGVSQSREYPSKLKDSLSSPIEALREKKLVDVTIEKDTESPSIKSDWLVRARPMEKMLEVNEEIDDPQYWAFHLAGRGMMGSKILGPQDDPLAECRKWVVKKGVGRARKAVQEWDRRHGNGDSPAIRHPHEQHPSGQHANGRHAGWTAALPDDTFSHGDPITKSSSTKRDFSAGKIAKPSRKASNTDSQRDREPLPGPLETRERAVEEKISIYLRLIDRDAHSDLYRRASGFIDQNYSKFRGVRRRVLIREAVGRIFLEKEGAESLPDPLSDQLE